MSFILSINSSLANVPIPSIGDVVAFVDVDGKLKTRDHTGAVIESANYDDTALSVMTAAAGTAAAAAQATATAAGTAAAAAQATATAAGTAAEAAQATATAAGTAANNAQSTAAAAGMAADSAGTAAAAAQATASSASTGATLAQLAANAAQAAAAGAGVAADISALSINAQRVGVVAGLDVQALGKAFDLRGRAIRFKGSLKLVSTAIGTVAMGVTVAGYVFTFPTLATTATTQYYNYEVIVFVLPAGANPAAAFATVSHSIAAAGVGAAQSRANQSAVSGAYANNNALLQVKTPVTSSITTLYALAEVL